MLPTTSPAVVLLVAPGQVPLYAACVVQDCNEVTGRSSRGARRAWTVLVVGVICAPLSCVLLSDFDALVGDGRLVSDSGASEVDAPEADAANEDAGLDGAPDAPTEASTDSPADDVALDAIADAVGEDAFVSTPGLPVLVAAVQGHVWALLADGDDIFWTTDEVVLSDGGLGSAVYRASQGCQGGSCGNMLALASGSTKLTDIAADFEWLYYGEIDTGRINRVGKLTGEIQTLAEGQQNPLGLAISATYVYWTGYDTATQGYVRRAPKSPIATDASAAAAVPMLENLDRPQFLAADPYGLKLFWGTDTENKIQSCYPIVSDGGAPTCNVKTLSSGTLEDAGPGNAQILKLAVDSTHVYWREGLWFGSSWTLAAVRRVEKDGNAAPDGGPSEILAEGAVASRPRWLALDQTYVYWTAGDAGKVYRTTKTPGGAIELVNSVDIPGVHSVVAVDGAVFVSSWASGEIFRIAL